MTIANIFTLAWAKFRVRDLGKLLVQIISQRNITEFSSVDMACKDKGVCIVLDTYQIVH